MKTCTYISGPPCVGKSTVALAVSRLVPRMEHVRGDEYWITHPGKSFEDRVSATNQDVLSAIGNVASPDVLCEWVPCRGPFVAQLHATCISMGRQFLHVILTASAPVLRKRKRERDGDEDLGPTLIAVPVAQTVYRCLVFDTEQAEIACMADEISKWILSNQAVYAIGAGAPQHDG